MKYDWNDISVIPAIISNIRSRSEISTRYSNKLPLFISPMDTVIDETNALLFLNMGFEVCLPRHILFDDNPSLIECFFSFGISDIDKILNSKGTLPPKVLIDVANGHMKHLVDLTNEIKQNYDVELMIGNIANPETYRLYAHTNVDYIRCGIGGGSACTTSANGGVHYPMASLIKECYDISCEFINPPKIIADGGFKNYPDIIKSIGIGSDYVMLGGIISKSLESASECFIKQDNGEYIQVSHIDSLDYIKQGVNVYKYFRGMSTKEVQKEWGKKHIVTAEGISYFNKVEYSLTSWVENFEDYLKSNMSCSDKRTLELYVGNAKFVNITQNAFNRFNK